MEGFEKRNTGSKLSREHQLVPNCHANTNSFSCISSTAIRMRRLSDLVRRWSAIAASKTGSHSSRADIDNRIPSMYEFRISCSFSSRDTSSTILSAFSGLSNRTLSLTFAGCIVNSRRGLIVGVSGLRRWWRFTGILFMLILLLFVEHLEDRFLW